MEEFEGDHNMEAFLLALRTLAKTKGGLTKIARETNLSRQNLYKSLSSNGNPRLSTLDAVYQGFWISPFDYSYGV
jgi:probable addiction module antidote protein